MSFEETAGNYSLTDVYAKAQIQSVHDAVREQILEFLGDDSGILLEDVQNFFLQSGEECKRGSPMYLKLLEKIWLYRVGHNDWPAIFQVSNSH